MKKRGILHGSITDKIEKFGNKIPHPIYIFLILIAVIMIVSTIFAGTTVTYQLSNSAGEISEKTVTVTSQLSREALQNWLVNVVNYFKNATTIMVILTLALCLSVAEQSGFFETALTAILRKSPKTLVTYVLGIVGICCSILADAGVVLSASLGAVAFKSIRRNPVAGLMIGYASAAAGYTANLFPCATDVTLNSVTEVMAPTYGYSSNLLSNWFYMIALTLVMGVVIAIVAERTVCKMFPDDQVFDNVSTQDEEIGISDAQKRGLLYAVIAGGIVIALIIVMTIPSDGFFRANDGSILPKSPLMSGIVPIIGMIFVAFGIAYGIGAGTIKNSNDVPRMMTKGMASFSSLIVVMFFASQMISIFGTSGLGTVIAVKGKDFLTSISLTGLPLLIVFTLVVCVINFFMASNSAKWFILGPVFIPMFAGMDIHPAWTQLAYRIGDSCTNNITPVFSGFVICLAMLEGYIGKKEGSNSCVGTFLAAQVPLSLAFWVVYIIMLIVFWIFNLPIGVGIYR